MTVEEITEVPPGATVVHEPHGFVHLQASNADDLMVVNAARVSFRKQSKWQWKTSDGQTWEDYDDADDHQWGKLNSASFDGPDVEEILAEADEKVLRFLLKGKHGTPFEHTFFQFHIRAPIFVFREWHRHRIGVSINEESARYVPLQPHFYLPDDEHVRVQKGKPGAYTFEPMGDQGIHGPNSKLTYGDYTRSQLEASYEHAYEAYQRLMEKGVAKEIARACLPVGIYSQMVWTCNARSLMNFLALRNAPTALREIRDYAEAMEAMFAKAMPCTHAAFVENGRVAP